MAWMKFNRPSPKLSGEKESNAPSNSNDGALVFQGGGGLTETEGARSISWQISGDKGAERAAAARARLARVASIVRVPIQ